jgi:hypothetical protein
MNKSIVFLKWVVTAVIVEVAIIFCLLLVCNNYLGREQCVIKSDGEGYYDYLPSIFIHHDFIRKDNPFQDQAALYKRVHTIGFYLPYKEFKVNKYPCGTAVLEIPFFASAYFNTTLDGNEKDGAQQPFQDAIFFAVIFYLALGLIFLRELLKLYGVKIWTIIFAQVLLVFATSITNYINFDGSFSHVYSFFAVTAFLYFTTSYFKNRNLQHFLWACVFLGLVLILRQINVLVVLFVPFMAGSWENLKSGVTGIFKAYKKLILGMVLLLSIFSIQSMAWYLQTGDAFLDSYQGEGFDFTDPQLMNIWFSYKKGLFVYAPFLFIALSGLAWFLYKKQYYPFFTWCFFFLAISYVFSSWHAWGYGCSYGSRVYVDYYTIFLIPFVLLLDGAIVSLKLGIVALSLLTIPLNVIQTYQYKVFILHWTEMNKLSYWKVFLKTDDRFKGILCKRNYDFSHFNTVKTIDLGDLRVKAKTNQVLVKIATKDIPDFNQVSIVQVFIGNEYDEKNNSRIIMSIRENESGYVPYWHNPHLLNFSERELNTPQTGVYNFEINPIPDGPEKTFTLEVEAIDQACDLKNIRINFLKWRP